MGKLKKVLAVWQGIGYRLCNEFSEEKYFVLMA